MPVLRQYNPNAIAGAHNSTTSAVENDHLVGNVGWNHEGLAWYATNGPNLEIQGRWLRHERLGKPRALLDRR